MPQGTKRRAKRQWLLSERSRYFRWLPIRDERRNLGRVLYARKISSERETFSSVHIAGVVFVVDSRSCGVIRFGLFEAHLHSGELRKDGIRIHLQEQPFQVLTVLLQHAGELVTREQLRQQVWPQDTFVEFDHALNTAIKKIRAALCDDAAIPRYVETIPKRGYRWIAPLRSAREPEIAAVDESPAVTELLPIPPQSRLSVPGTWKWFAALLLVGILAALGFRFTRYARPDGERSTLLVVLPIENWSDDAEQARTCRGITEDMIGELAGLHMAHIQVVPDSTAIQYEHTSKTPNEIGRELGAGLILQANLRRTPRHVRLSAELVRIRDGARLWGNSFDHPPADALEVEADLAHQVAADLQPALRSATP